MPRTPATIGRTLAATTPDAPYAPQPTPGELLAALTFVLDGGYHDNARQLVAHSEQWRAWKARTDALQGAIVSHWTQGRPCNCKRCESWRAEHRRMWEAKGAHDDQARQLTKPSS